MIPRAAPGILLCVAALAATVAVPVSAQISPGPLARAHRGLEGPLHCTKCHAGGRAALSTNCLSCHQDIAWLNERGRGYHTRERKTSCASCHPDHAGEAFDLIKWPDGSQERFDHERAGWSLAGKHATTPCVDCHTAKYRVSAAARLAAQPTSGGAMWTGLETSCTACHADPHRGGLGRDCTRCHNPERWNSTSGFDHARTRYPLTGRHASVTCNACHAAPRVGPRAVFRGLAFAECSVCHADPHAGRLGPKCAACHVTQGFDVLTASTFEHDRTRYPLRGAHRRTACDACHDFSGHAGTRRDPVAFAACTDCHRDPHAGAATLAGRVVGCDACHDVGAFTPSTFTAARHSATRYPLEGGHLEVRCSGCHRTENAGGRNATVVIRPAFTRCRDCHTMDPHRGASAARDCVECHDTRGYRPSTVDVATHARFSFALAGAHRAVPCAACHRDMKTFTAAGTCAGCHPGPHGTQFAARADRGRCDACHGTDAWRPAGGFDHTRDAGFSLAGAHARVPCERCHRPARPGGVTVYRAASPKCESCHGPGRRS